jgi:hypothetical protein
MKKEGEMGRETYGIGPAMAGTARMAAATAAVVSWTMLSV